MLATVRFAARITLRLALSSIFLCPYSVLSLSNIMVTPEARFITNTMCPFAQKAWLALECAGVPYKLEEISLYGANGKPNWFWELNPKGTVPVLVCAGDGDPVVVLPDSDLILDYIEQGKIDGAASLLVGTSSNILAREWRTVINEKLIPAGKQAVLGGSKQNLLDILKLLDKKAKRPFLLGDDVTTADCHAFPFLWRIHQEFGLGEYPALARWLDHCCQHPDFRKTIKEPWWWWW